MEKQIKLAFVGTTVLCLCAALSGCGANTINLNDYVDIEFEGYDTVGNALCTIDFEQIIDDNEEAFGLDEDSDETDYYKIYTALTKEISGKLDENSSLTNGDVINFEWDDIDTEKLEEKLSVKFKFSDRELTVEGLDEPEEFNPFDFITVNFNGISPNGTISIETNSDIPVHGLRFEASEYETLKNDDKIIITVNSGDNLTESCLRYGMIPTTDEQVYTVEGLPFYADKIAQIPEETKAQMLKQAEDSIRASCSGWADGNSLKRLEHVGDYFLTVKDGFNAKPVNEIFCVYKVTAYIVGCLESEPEDARSDGGEETYYTYFRYSDIMLLPDGTCSLDLSRGSEANNKVNTNHGYWSWGRFKPYTLYGYKELDSMFNSCVTSKIDKYSYENTVIS